MDRLSLFRFDNSRLLRRGLLMLLLMVLMRILFLTSLFIFILFLVLLLFFIFTITSLFFLFFVTMRNSIIDSLCIFLEVFLMIPVHIGWMVLHIQIYPSLIHIFISYERLNFFSWCTLLGFWETGWESSFPKWIHYLIVHVLIQFYYFGYPFVKINWLDFCDVYS